MPLVGERVHPVSLELSLKLGRVSGHFPQELVAQGHKDNGTCCRKLFSDDIYGIKSNR